MKKVVMLSAATLLALSTIATQAQESAPAATEAPAAAAPAASTDAAAPAKEGEADAAAAPADAAATDTAKAGDAAATDAAAPAEGEAAPAAAPAEEAPKDSPQVQKLIAMYPNLVARIAPFGKVCFSDEEDKCDIKIVALAPAVEGEARPGDMLYKAICSTCHDTGLLGSPKFGDPAAWAPRIGKGKDTLYNHAINGFNAMPARGGADISDDEVHNAVDYMLEHSS